MKQEDADEIRRLCHILNKGELTTAFLRIAGSYGVHYEIESTLRKILERRHEEAEAEQDAAEVQARKAYEELYAEMTKKYGNGLSTAPTDEKIELMRRLAEWAELVQKGIRLTRKHDEELFGGGTICPDPEAGLYVRIH